MVFEAEWLPDPVGVGWVVCWWCKSMSWFEDTRPGTVVVLDIGTAGVVASGVGVLGEIWQLLDQH